MVKASQRAQDPVTIYISKKMGDINTLLTMQECNHNSHSRRLSKQKKQNFFELITKGNLNIKNAARKVGIGYSTAKKIYSKFRANNILTKNYVQFESQNPPIRATYSQAKQNLNPVSIISLIGGKANKI